MYSHYELFKVIKIILEVYPLERQIIGGVWCLLQRLSASPHVNVLLAGVCLQEDAGKRQQQRPICERKRRQQEGSGLLWLSSLD